MQVTCESRMIPKFGGQVISIKCCKGTELTEAIKYQTSVLITPMFHTKCQFSQGKSTTNHIVIIQGPNSHTSGLSNEVLQDSVP